MIHSIQLYKAGKVKNIIITGGSGALVGKKVPEAQHLKKVFLFSGVANSAIVIEAESRNTAENARFSRKLIDSLQLKPKFLLVTSAFHMPRAMGCFNMAGVSVESYPTDFYTGDRNIDFEDIVVPAEIAL